MLAQLLVGVFRMGAKEVNTVVKELRELYFKDEDDLIMTVRNRRNFRGLSDDDRDVAEDLALSDFPWKNDRRALESRLLFEKREYNKRARIRLDSFYLDKFNKVGLKMAIDGMLEIRERNCA